MLFRCEDGFMQLGGAFGRMLRDGRFLLSAVTEDSVHPLFDYGA
jgi:hypothetical protein